jgi:uncharacterized coiled-coil protein SlyX
MAERVKRVVKKIKAAIRALLIASIVPTLKIGGDEQAATEKSTPTETTKPAIPSKSPEERIRELEAELSSKETRLEELEKLAGESQAQAAHLGESLKGAIDGYKALIIASNPDVLPELINGENIEALNNSLAKGKELTGKVKTNLEAQAQKSRVPAGSPVRGPEDVSGLSAREKINRGLGR